MSLVSVSHKSAWQGCDRCDVLLVLPEEVDAGETLSVKTVCEGVTVEVLMGSQGKGCCVPLKRKAHCGGEVGELGMSITY